ncbi:MAG: hypothetical protein ACTSVS_06220 [Candidatus Heimdallarchaeota archaeon]
MIPEKVAEEINQKGAPLHRFIKKYPETITSFQPNEEEEYLRIRRQIGIDDGEAAAIAVALSRNKPLVIEDKKGRNKAQNHGIECLSWNEFLEK